MGALNQPSREEIERRRAARALYALGWLFVCIVLYEAAWGSFMDLSVN